MDPEHHGEFYKYNDGEISMRVPSYLREKEGFFEQRSKTGRQYPVLHFIVAAQQSAGEVQREIIMRMTPGVTEDMPGVWRHVIRRGETSYLPGGLELLGSVTISESGVHHYYNVLFPLGSRYVYADFMGQGDVSEFEQQCRDIVLSIRLVHGRRPRVAKMSRRGGGGLSRTAKQRLSKALNNLPGEIAYLKRPILAIADEDQDLLGSGEVDIAPVEKALKQLTKKSDLRSVAQKHAEILHEWLLTLPDEASAWAGPAGFTEGALRGIAMWS